jgi:DNA-binding Lrp family transcriptional regulator
MQLKLTSKERLVLYGLARYPGLSDIDLASRINVDRSTIFKSKRKFRDWKLIRLLNVPSGVAVGAEMLTVLLTKYNPTVTHELRRKESAYENWINNPNCVFQISTDTDSISMIFSKSLSDYRSNFDPLIDEYMDKKFIEDLFCFHYPFRLTSYSCDVATAVSNTFDLARADLPETKIPERGPVKKQRLTDKDKLVLYAFVKYPGLSDLELSRRTGISRPTISGKRNKFFQNGMLNREAYIDWEKLGCELLSFYNINISPKADSGDLIRVYNSLKNIGAPLFNFIQPRDAFGAVLSSSYPELKRRMDAETRFLTEQNLIDKRPLHVIVPLREVKFRKIDYSQMVKVMLDIRKEI